MIDVKSIKQETEQKLQKAKQAFDRACGSLRTGRAHPALVENIMAEIYGNKQPLKQVAKISVSDPRTLKIVPFDKSQVKSIETAIRDSDLGINPTVVGTEIILPLPALTEERRRDLVKVLKGILEEHRIEIRNVRRDANEGFKELQKAKTISEDESERAKTEIQKLVDAATKDIEGAAADKEKELLAI